MRNYPAYSYSKRVKVWGFWMGEKIRESILENDLMLALSGLTWFLVHSYFATCAVPHLGLPGISGEKGI